MEKIMRSFFLIVLLSTSVMASTAQLKEGNRQFKNGHYDEALKLYEDALIDTPYSSILHFNAGDATANMNHLDLAQMDPLKFMFTPGLWLGLLVAAILFAAAVWQRRYRAPI